MSRVKNKLSNYQPLPRDLIFDNTLSDRARFVYCYMASKPDGWDFILGAMAEDLGYTKETLRKYISELVTAGWITKGKQIVEDGRWGAIEYEVNDTKKPCTEKPCTEKTDSENNQHKDNRDEERKENTNNDNTSSKKYKKNGNKFDFRQSLIDAGADIDVVDAWMQIRNKNKNNSYSYDLFVREVKKACISIKEAVLFSCENGWQGFKAEWYNNKKNIFGYDTRGFRGSNKVIFEPTDSNEHGTDKRPF